MYGQIVVGPPGSGKSTYCEGMHQFLTGLGRKVAVVNLDPANETVHYECAIDIVDLMSVPRAMEELGLGPNGGTIFCLEYLEANFDWLYKKLSKLKDHYILFDCPGQVELVTHHKSLQNMLKRLVKDLKFQIVAVHLVDSNYCADASKFISAMLLSLSTMLRLELPHVNILSKVDLLETTGKLPFGLEFYTKALDLPMLLRHIQNRDHGNERKNATGSTRLQKTFKSLNAAFCELIDDFKLVSFLTLDVQEKRSMARVAQQIDKAISYNGPGASILKQFTFDEGKWLHELQSKRLSGPPVASPAVQEDTYRAIPDEKWAEMTRRK